MKQELSVKIAPSVLAADFGSLGAEIEDLERCGADLIHIDVMDGNFVPPITFGECMVKTARAHSGLYLETHLMISNPSLHFDSFIDAGSDRIIFHVEADNHIHYSLEQLRSKGTSTGIAVNPGTPVESVFEVLELCDVVLIMTVNPGWGGQPFIEKSLQRLAKLKTEIARRDLSTLIEVDGGVNPTTGAQCRHAGAEILVAGSSIFRSKDRREAIRLLRTWPLSNLDGSPRGQAK